MKNFSVFTALLFLILTIFDQALFAQTSSQSWSLNPYDEKVFIENAGQSGEIESLLKDKVLFSFKQGNTAFFFCRDKYVVRKAKYDDEAFAFETRDPATEHFPSPAYSYFTFSLVNANPSVIIEGKDQSPAPHKYYLPDAAGKKRMLIASGYSKVIYQNVYENIDLVFSPHEKNGLKYQFVIHPHADPGAVKISYNGKGSLSLDESGNLHAGIPGEEIMDFAPHTFYADDSIAIPSSYEVKGNSFSFNTSDYDKSKTILIDPWVIDPEFTDQNKAFDIASDFLGNIYVFGGHEPWQYKKFDPNGNLLWSFDTPFQEWYGAFAVEPGGFSIIVEGCCGGNIIRLNPDGDVEWNIVNGVDEYWRVVYTCDYTNLYLAAGYASSPGLQFTSISLLDAITGEISNSTNVFEGQTSEPRALAVGLDGSIYTVSCTGTYDANEVASLTPSFSVQFSVPSGYNLLYNGPLYANGDNTTAGQNGVSGGKNFFCTSDGATLIKRAISDGDELTSVSITNGSVEGNSGVLVDSCDNVFAGSSDAVIKYDSDLGFVSSTPTSGEVYCLAAGINGALLVAGNGFIASLDMSVCRKFCGGKYSGVTMVNAQDQFSIFPNPVADELTIDAHIVNSKDEKTKILITDMLGRKLMEKTMDYSKHMVLNVERLPSGIYFLKAENDGTAFSARFVKK